MNPWAVMKNPLTMEDYMNARWIAEPVNLFDCDMPVNGAFAFLLAREDIATVERYWSFGDFHSSAAGFVLRLRDGRRAYAELQHTHAYEQVEDFRVDVVPLDADEPPPMPTRPLEPREWSDETAHLDRVLAG